MRPGTCFPPSMEEKWYNIAMKNDKAFAMFFNAGPREGDCGRLMQWLNIPPACCRDGQRLSPGNCRGFQGVPSAIARNMV